MASSRGMRKSPRNASPMTGSTQVSTASDAGTVAVKSKDVSSDEWVEPKMRAPAPSFEDHRGLERHGVLEQMAPLGTMPPQNKRLRLKEWQPTQPSSSEKRAAGSGDAVPADGVKEVEDSERARRSESRKVDDKSVRRGSLRGKGGEDTEHAPNRASRPPSSKSANAQPVTDLRESEEPTMSTPAGRKRLEYIVSAAVKRSKEIGNAIIGLAIRKVYYESLNNPTLAVVIEAVLNQRASPEQTTTFQSYIKIAKRQIRNEPESGATSPSIQSTAPTPTTTAAPAPAPAPSSSLPQSPLKRTRRSTSRNVAATESKERHTSTPVKNKTRANGAMSHANGNKDDTRPAKKIKRSGSVSSESSLSSTHSLELEAEVSESNDLPTLRTRSGGNLKLHTFVGKNGKRSQGGSASASGKVVNQEDAADVELAAKKSKLTQSFNDYEVKDSSIRGEPEPGRPSLKTTTLPKLQTPTTSRSNNQEEYDEIASPASSFQGEFLVPPPPGALRVSRSRGVTPTALGRPRKEEPRRMARLKMSPNKKKTGTPGAGRESSRLREREKESGAAANDSDSGDGENNDYCTSCGGNGELLCCDGCPRSFHLWCFDPPLTSAPEGEWLCFHCEAKREPHARPPRGILSSLVDKARWLNPKQFSLRDYLRLYFDSVKIGEDGDYEEASLSKPKQRQLNHHGRDEAEDKFKFKDARGKPILCFRCGKSSLGHREIINCDYCTLKWHLDCLSPPLANAPIRDPYSTNKARNSWMCPAHCPSELGTSEYGGRSIKMRRPRNARVIESMLPRGVKNNGLIEIENDPSDDETGYDMEDNIVYRVTEKSVKMDFIDRVYKRREDAAVRDATLREAARQQALRDAEAVRRANIAFNNRSFIEREAALTLAQFAQTNAKPGLEPDQVQPLINALISNASDESIALITAEEEDKTKNNGIPAIDLDGANPSSMAPTPPGSDAQDRVLTTKQKQSYILLMDLIQKRLDEAENA